MVRFYGTGIVDLPEYLLITLFRCIDPIRAEEATWNANAARVGILTHDGYKKALKHWAKMAAPYDPNAGIVSINPSQEKWFIDNQIPYRLAAVTTTQ